jgi:hypothetical protein
VADAKDVAMSRHSQLEAAQKKGKPSCFLKRKAIVTRSVSMRRDMNGKNSSQLCAMSFWLWLFTER